LKGIQWRVGVEVDTLTIQLYCDPTKASQLVEQSVVMLAVQQGLLDNATVVVQRLFSATFGSWSAGSITLFRGNIADIKCDQAHAECSVKSRKELLNIPMPYNTYQQSCRWPLYSLGCGISAPAFQVNATVATGSIPLLLNTTLSNIDHYFDEGYLIFTTGANMGVRRAVRQYLNASGQILFFIPLPNTPATGDVFQAFPGCDHTSATCLNKFSNLINFGGMPFLPIPETAVAILLSFGFTLHWIVERLCSYIRS
jgi:uncharacterized phage protein (TIGR02218 family)